MGQDPDTIRREIEETRGEMGETLDAIGYKADVRTRAKESVSSKAEAVRSKVGGVMGRANEATPSTGEMKDGAQQAASVAQENPLGLALGAVAVGFVAGMLVPTTRVEDERIGPVADQVKDKARETGQEALERGKQVAQEAAQSAQETARDSAQQHGQELKESAQQNAQDVQQAGQQQAQQVAS